MTDDFQTIDGVGPSREEDLRDAGYETYRDLAAAEATDLEAEIPRLSEDKALEIIVQAQNSADLADADTEVNPEAETTDADEPAPRADDETDAASAESAEDGDTAVADDEPDVYTVELSIDAAAEYDALYDTLLDWRQTLIGTNRPGVETVSGYIDELRAADVGETITFAVSADELNDLHNTVLQSRIDYQGKNLHDEMEALREMEQKINDVRQAKLFS